LILSANADTQIHTKPEESQIAQKISGTVFREKTQNRLVVCIHIDRVCVVYNKGAEGEIMKSFQILALFLCVLVASHSWIQAETNKDEDALKKQIEEL
jgi:hypothetical protein